MMNPTPKRTSSLKRLAAIASLATLLVGGLAAAWATCADREAQRQTIRQHTRQVEDHEARLRTVEKDLGQIARDVKWVRGWMEKRDK